MPAVLNLLDDISFLEKQRIKKMDKKLLLLRKKLSSKEILGNRKYCVLCDLWRFAIVCL